MAPDDVIRDHVVFRVLLQAMSRPGRTYRLPLVPGWREPGAWIAATLRTLVDEEVGCFVLEDGTARVARETQRVTGCRLVEAGAADFLVFPGGESGDVLEQARRGTAEYPDGGATVVYWVQRLEEDGGATDLRGPGIDGVVRPVMRGLGDRELARLRQVNAGFPQGVDALFLDADGGVMAIPRSTRIGAD